MIIIDGSRYEGGGQLVRGAVTLAAMWGEEIEILNVRESRSEPGFKAQHIAAVKAVAGLCDAGCDGVVPGGRRLVFSPGRIRRTDDAVHIGTAGSIALVLQAWLPAALVCGGRLTVTGGTEVQHSPTIDYFDRVFCELLRQNGATIKIDVIKRGYYPRGGGQVTVEVGPFQPRPLRIPTETERECAIISCSSNLPEHVAIRQADAAAERLRPVLGDLPISLDVRTGQSTGSSCTAVCSWKGGIALGSRGYPAEAVGRDAADSLLEALREPGCVDSHLADQLIILLSRYGGSFTTTNLSLHARTMCWLTGLFGSTITYRRHDDGSTEISA
jgi:RNA 3'-terminal phosphate cyclase (ATP)